MMRSILTGLTKRRPGTGRVLALWVLLGLLGEAIAETDTVFRLEDTQPFTVTYSVGNNLITAGNASLTLSKLDDSLWRYQLTTSPIGVFKLTGKGNIEETSTLQFIQAPEEGLLLRGASYQYRQDKERRRAVDATFDWAAETLEWTRRGETQSAPLTDGPIIDRLSVTLAVMSALRQGKETMQYRVFDNGRIKNVIFSVQGEDQLDTSLGSLDTVRVLRINAEGSSRSTITWFAPSLNYVPVKIEQLKRGELVARLTLKSLKNDAAEIIVPSIKSQ